MRPKRPSAHDVREGLFLLYQPWAVPTEEQAVPDSVDGSGEGGALTQAQVEELVKERLAEAKAANDEAFQNLWKEAKEAKKRAKAFGDMDPEDVRDRLAKLADLEQQGKAAKAGLTKEQLDELRREERELVEKEFAPFKSEVERLRGELRSRTLDDEVMALMVKHGVRPDKAKKLFQLESENFDLTDDNEPFLAKAPGKDIGKFIEAELAKEYPEWFVGSGSSGGGASKSAGGAGGRVRTIAAGDNAAFLANLEGIASGEVTVTD